MRSVTLIICAAAVALSGCGAKSIGIIGGADGPTKVVVSDDKGSTEYGRETVKMIRRDGALYYDRGKKSDAEGRCGILHSVAALCKKQPPKSKPQRTDLRQEPDAIAG